MIRIASGASRRLASAAALVLATVLLASCGSGGVSNDNATGAGTGPVSISPATATLYSEVPTTFVLSGGSGSYLVASSNQAVVPVASNIRINSFTVVPADVASDTAVTLTVTDANNATVIPATATLTVKARTISSTVTITPSSTQAAACGTAICAGGDAQVTAVLSQAGLPLANRVVRFDVVSGDVRIITSAPGDPEVDSLSGTTTTDSTGTARIRIRVLASATSQTALLRITDVTSGFSQTASVTISPVSGAPLNAQPSTISFTGPDANTCATGISADVIVFGGRPPYNISSPGAFGIYPTVVTSSGGRFQVTATGQCSTASTIAIVDANGASTTVTVTNALGTVAPPPFVVAPTEVTFTDCGQSAGIALAGGTGAYYASAGGSPLDVEVAGSAGIITLPVQAFTSTNTTPSAPPFDLQAGFSDGQTVQPVTVHVLGTASC
ncbi:MAG TPA: hypothetical protein VLY46_01135 [Usitatibacter sp.]|nr:hypothetical protein [Usitatibacter sp.]